MLNNAYQSGGGGWSGSYVFVFVNVKQFLLTTFCDLVRRPENKVRANMGVNPFRFSYGCGDSCGLS